MLDVAPSAFSEEIDKAVFSSIFVPGDPYQYVPAEPTNINGTQLNRPISMRFNGCGNHLT